MLTQFKTPVFDDLAMPSLTPLTLYMYYYSIGVNWSIQRVNPVLQVDAVLLYVWAREQGHSSLCLGDVGIILSL